MKLSSCKPSDRYGESACEEGGPTSIEALHLSWHTELFAGEGASDLVSGSGKGTPGFVLKCKAWWGENIKDECLGLATAALKNESGAVAAKFGEERLVCTLGGAYRGKLLGEQTISLNYGASLEVS